MNCFNKAARSVGLASLMSRFDSIFICFHQEPPEDLRDINRFKAKAIVLNCRVKNLEKHKDT